MKGQKTKEIMEAIASEKPLKEIYGALPEIKKPTVRCVLNTGVKKGTVTRVSKGRYKIAKDEPKKLD